MIERLKGLYHFVVALFSVCKFRFPSRKLTVIGVTGTDGKTTTASLIYEILKASGYKVSKITSVHAVIAGREYDTGFHVTCPDSYYVQKYLREAVDHGDTHFVMEVTSHGIAQHRVFGVKFAVAVITNVTHEHLDWHKTFANYRDTKISLLRRAATVVINRDDAELYNAAIPRLKRNKLVTYGIRRESIVSPVTYNLKTLLPGEFNRYNCLAALAVSYALGVPKKIALPAVANFDGVPGRMEMVQSEPFQVIVDFAHTPNALVQALKTVRTMTRRRVIHVFGSAGERDLSKRQLMGRASSQYADLIILTEEDYRSENVEEIINQIARGIAPEKIVHRFFNRGEAIAFALSQADKGDTVVITGKGHEKSICRGKVEYPWSDQEAVRNFMKKRGKK